MKTNYLIMLLITGLIVTGATVVGANPDDLMQNLGKPGFNLLSQINLNSEQTEKIRELGLTHETAISPLRILEHQIRAELNIFWLQLSPDIEKIKSAQKKIHDIRFQILEKETDYRIAVRHVLTEDQLSQFLALGGDRCQGPDKFDHHPPRPLQSERY